MGGKGGLHARVCVGEKMLFTVCFLCHLIAWLADCSLGSRERERDYALTLSPYRERERERERERRGK